MFRSIILIVTVVAAVGTISAGAAVVGTVTASRALNHVSQTSILMSDQSPRI